MTPCDRTVSVAPYVLGALPPGERASLEAHAMTCEICRAELRELAPVGAALRLGGPMPAAFDASFDMPHDRVERALLTTIAAEQRRDRRAVFMRRALVAASLLLVVGLLTVLWARRDKTGGDSLPIAAIERLELESPAGVRAFVRLSNYPTGAYATVRGSGLPKGHVYRMWFEYPDGSRLPFGSFRATGGSWDQCWGGVGVDLIELSAIGASDEYGKDILRGEFTIARSTAGVTQKP